MAKNQSRFLHKVSMAPDATETTELQEPYLHEQASLPCPSSYPPPLRPSLAGSCPAFLQVVQKIRTINLNKMTRRLTLNGNEITSPLQVTSAKSLALRAACPSTKPESQMPKWEKFPGMNPYSLPILYLISFSLL